MTSPFDKDGQEQARRERSWDAGSLVVATTLKAWRSPPADRDAGLAAALTNAVAAEQERGTPCERLVAWDSTQDAIAKAKS